MRIIGIIVVVLVLLSAGTCAIRNRGDDGPNTRTATVNVAQAANEPFDNAALKQSLKDNKVNDEDARKIAASAVEANTVRGQSKTVIVSALDKLSNDADTAEVIKTLDNLGKAAQAPTTPTPKPEDKSTPTPGTTPAAGKALTDAEVRTIVQDEAKKNPSLTQDQVQKLINDAIANNKSAGGLTEAQVKNIVSETIKNMPTGLTEAQIRQIAADEARKNNPGITQDQIQTMINKAVADAVAASQKAGGLSEVQVRNIINEALRNYSPNPGGVPGAGGATTTPQTGGTIFIGQSTPTKCGPVTWGPAGPAPGVGTSDSGKQVNDAVQAMQIDLNSANYTTVHKFCPGDDTPNGWVVGSSWTEANRIVVNANYLKAGVCVDYDPNVTKVTGDVYHTQVLNPLWSRTQIKSDGAASGLKFTVYFTPCGFTDGTPSWNGTGAPQATAAPTTGTSTTSGDCPANAQAVATLTNTPASWAKLSNESCAWLYGGTKVGLTVPQGYEVDYDAGGQPGKKHAGEAVPSGIVFTLRKLG